MCVCVCVCVCVYIHASSSAVLSSLLDSLLVYLRHELCLSAALHAQAGAKDVVEGAASKAKGSAPDESKTPKVRGCRLLGSLLSRQGADTGSQDTAAAGKGGGAKDIVEGAASKAKGTAPDESTTQKVRSACLPAHWPKDSTLKTCSLQDAANPNSEGLRATLSLACCLSWPHTDVHALAGKK